MAVIDDLISSGLSVAQADAVVALDAGTATVADLVSAGFSSIQATELLADEAGSGSDAALAAAGFWVGTQVPAINAALAVVD